MTSASRRRLDMLSRTSSPPLIRRYDYFCTSLYNVTRRLLLPSLVNSQYAYRSVLAEMLRGLGGGSWLELGCGHDLLPAWMGDGPLALPVDGWRITGVDLDRQALARHQGLACRVHGNIERLPFKNGVFDLVTANMVIEHVEKPSDLFHEVARVLKPGGRFVVHTPNGHAYSTLAARFLPRAWLARMAHVLLDRDESDVYQTYYRANSGAELDALSRRAELIPENVRYVPSSPQMIRIPPLMAAEVAWARILAVPRFAHLRACIIADFRKPTTLRPPA